MRIGIVSDIHESVVSLERALTIFRSERVDAVMSLGDACDTWRSKTAVAVAALLREAGAIGVWGNHDFGLCHEVSDQLRQEAEPEFLEFMAGMRPRIVLENCHFSHKEPWLDASKIEDLWHFDGRPDTPERAARSFAAVAERHLFVGDLHCWRAMTPYRRMNWNGDRPLKLSAESRSLVVIAAVLDGWCAIFDTAESLLIPIKCFIEAEPPPGLRAKT